MTIHVFLVLLNLYKTIICLITFTKQLHNRANFPIIKLTNLYIFRFFTKSYYKYVPYSKFDKGQYLNNILNYIY